MYTKFKLLIFTLLFASNLNGMEDDPRKVFEAIFAHCIFDNDYNKIKAAITPFRDLINKQHPHSWTPLHFAAYYQKPSLTRILLELGANVNATIDNGETPLHTCADSLHANNLMVTRLLLDAGADLNATNITGHTPAQHARRWGRPKFAEELEAEAERRARWDAKKDWLAAVAVISKSFEE